MLNLKNVIASSKKKKNSGFIIDAANNMKDLKSFNCRLGCQ